jgi:hypothetical protein
MTGSNQSSHADVAAYVLGVLDHKDNLAFERHLLDCAHCQLEMLEMHDLPEILEDVKRSWPEPPLPEPSPRVLNALLEEAAGVRKKRRNTARLAVAAGLLVAAVGSVLTLTLFAQDGSQDQPPRAAATQQAEVRTGSGPVKTGSAGLLGQTEQSGDVVRAKISLEPRDYGTQADLELSGITGPTHCQLIVVAKSGESQVVTSWTVPPKGFGTTDSPDPLRISGGTGFLPAQIERFEIRGEDGSVLVTISH